MIVLVLCKIYILVVFEKSMAISLRIIYWIPVVIFFILNMLFKLIINILMLVGNAVVWCNKKFVAAGDWSTDKANYDDKLDNFLESVQKKKAATKKMYDAKRGRK